MSRAICVVLACSLLSAGASLASGLMVEAEGRGFPLVTMADGVALSSLFTGDAAGLLQSVDVRGLSLAAADFDEDRIDDLVSGHAAGSGGVLVLRLANRDAIFPTGRDALRRSHSREFHEPFHPEARVSAVPIAPDFLGTGDFDADGHADVVAAARGDAALYLLTGDGYGNLASAERIDLPGRLTALHVADVNRRDLKEDVIVAVEGPDGARLLVFQRPDGAFHGDPEVVELPEPGTAIATGLFVGPHPVDMVVGCGRRMVLISGRDRRLHRDPTGRSAKPPVVKTALLESSVESIVTGHFRKGPLAQLAVRLGDGTIRVVAGADLAAGKRGREATPFPGRWIGAATMTPVRCAALEFDNLLLVDREAHQLHLLIAPDARPAPPVVSFDVNEEPIAVLPMRLNVDPVSDLVVVTRGAVSPVVVPSTPRATFTVAFGNFDLGDVNPGDGICDATGLGQCTLRAAIQETNALGSSSLINFGIGSGDVTLVLNSELTSVKAATTIDGTTQPGGRIELDGTGLGASADGLTLDTNSVARVIRGLVINRFPGYGLRIPVVSQVWIEDNLLGTDVTGTTDLGNGSGGIAVYNASGVVTIGGVAPNLISGNTSSGVYAYDSTVLVEDNLIGTDVTGTSGLGNSVNGLSLNGGTATVQDNLISGNGTGCRVVGATYGTVIAGNKIGTDISGAAPVPNSYGTYVASPGVTIGGTGGTARNLISANSTAGVYLDPVYGSDCLVVGNYIGTTASGDLALGNATGVSAWGSDLTLGGVIAGSGNLISGNGTGVELLGDSADRAMVLGNLIGTDATGQVDQGNAYYGVLLNSGPTRCIIGGPTASERNVISGNGWSGVRITGSTTALNSVLGNYIGLAQDGATPLGNDGEGIRVDGSTCCNTIGGSPADGNRIAHNGAQGVWVSSGTGNLVSMNRIWDNGLLGIDLGSTGVTANDAGDVDTGANELQNYPVITAATRVGGTLIEGTIDSLPATTFTLELFSSSSCDTSGNGEGESYIGSDVVLTDGTGHADFVITIPTTLPTGSVVTATATDDDHNTSEFSACATTLDPPGMPGVTPPLMLTKSGGDIRLDWSAPAGGCGGNDYGVHQGSLATLGGGAYDHDSVACTTGGITSWSTAMPPGSLYFLVSSVTASKEGSYGQDSAGTERPSSVFYCKPRNLATCP